jgi:hypothetical protein
MATNYKGSARFQQFKKKYGHGDIQPISPDEKKETKLNLFERASLGIARTILPKSVEQMMGITKEQMQQTTKGKIEPQIDPSFYITMKTRGRNDLIRGLQRSGSRIPSSIKEEDFPKTRKEAEEIFKLSLSDEDYKTLAEQYVGEFKNTWPQFSEYLGPDFINKNTKDLANEYVSMWPDWAVMKPATEMNIMERTKKEIEEEQRKKGPEFLIKGLEFTENKINSAINALADNDLLFLDNPIWGEAVKEWIGEDVADEYFRNLPSFILKRGIQTATVNLLRFDEAQPDTTVERVLTPVIDGLVFVGSLAFGKGLIGLKFPKITQWISQPLKVKGVPLTRISPVLKNFMVDAGIVTVRGQLDPHLGLDFNKRLKAIGQENLALAKFFALGGLAGTGIKAIPIFGIGSAGLSWLEGADTPEIIGSGILGAILGGTGYFSHQRMAAMHKSHARMILQEKSGRTIPTNYKDSDIIDVAKDAHKASQKLWKGDNVMTRIDSDSITRSSEFLRSFAQDNRGFRFVKSEIKEMNRALKEIFPSLFKGKEVKNKVADTKTQLLPTKPGEPPYIADAEGKYVEAIKIGDRYIFVKKGDFTLDERGELTKEGRRNYESRLKKLVERLNKAKTFKSREDLKFKLDIHKQVGKDLGFDFVGDRITDVKISTKKMLAETPQFLEDPLNSLLDDFARVKTAKEVRYIENLRKGIEELSKTFRETPEKLAREILRRADVLELKSDNVVPESIKSWRIKDLTEGKRSEKSPVDIEAKIAEYEIRQKELTVDTKPEKAAKEKERRDFIAKNEKRAETLETRLPEPIIIKQTGKRLATVKDIVELAKKMEIKIPRGKRKMEGMPERIAEIERILDALGIDRGEFMEAFKWRKLPKKLTMPKDKRVKLTAKAEKKYNIDFLEKIAEAKEGEIVGKFGDFVKGEKIRTLYKDVLDIPIMVTNRPTQKGLKVRLPKGEIFRGAIGTHEGKTTIFVSNEKMPGIVSTLLEEGAHALRKIKGRKLTKIDLAKFDRGLYEKLPEEISAKKMVEFAKKITETIPKKPPEVKPPEVKPVGVEEMFRNKTGMSFYDPMIQVRKMPDRAMTYKEYFAKEKGIEANIVYMSPDEYLSKIVKAPPTKSSIDYMKAKLAKGEKLGIPVLDYTKTPIEQEGRNRAYLAKERGLKQIPVVEVRPITKPKPTPTKKKVVKPEVKPTKFEELKAERAKEEAKMIKLAEKLKEAKKAERIKGRKVPEKVVKEVKKVEKGLEEKIKIKDLPKEDQKLMRDYGHEKEISRKEYFNIKKEQLDIMEDNIMREEEILREEKEIGKDLGKIIDMEGEAYRIDKQMEHLAKKKKPDKAEIKRLIELRLEHEKKMIKEQERLEKTVDEKTNEVSRANKISGEEGKMTAEDTVNLSPADEARVDSNILKRIGIKGEESQQIFGKIEGLGGIRPIRGNIKELKGVPARLVNKEFGKTLPEMVKALADYGHKFSSPEALKNYIVANKLAYNTTIQNTKKFISWFQKTFDVVAPFEEIGKKNVGIKMKNLFGALRRWHQFSEEIHRQYEPVKNRGLAKKFWEELVTKGQVSDPTTIPGYTKSMMDAHRIHRRIYDEMLRQAQDAGMQIPHIRESFPKRIRRWNKALEAKLKSKKTPLDVKEKKAVQEKIEANKKLAELAEKLEYVPNEISAFLEKKLSEREIAPEIQREMIEKFVMEAQIEPMTKIEIDRTAKKLQEVAKREGIDISDKHAKILAKDFTEKAVKGEQYTMKNALRRIKETIGVSDAEARKMIISAIPNKILGRKTVSTEMLIDLMERQGISVATDARELQANYIKYLGEKMVYHKLLDTIKSEGLAYKFMELPPDKKHYKDVSKIVPDFVNYVVHPRIAEYFERYNHSIERGDVWKFMALTKMFQFYNPLFLSVYDIIQSAMAIGPKMLIRPKYLKEAWLDVKNRSDNYYQSMNNGTFSVPFINRFINWKETLKKNLDKFDSGERIGINLLGKRLAKDLSPKHPLAALTKLTSRGVMEFYTANWNIAWTGDRIIRQATYNYMTKERGYSPLEAAQTAAKFHGDYASVPRSTRRVLNNIFFTPTFKIAMYKLYSRMLSDSFKSAKDILKEHKLPTGPKAAYAMGLFWTMALMGGMDLLLTQGMGFERQTFGRRYYKEAVIDGERKEMVWTFAHPGNVWARHWERFIKPKPGVENFIMNRLKGVKWEAHPVWALAYELAFNEGFGFQKIYEPAEGQPKQWADIIKYSSSRLLGIHRAVLEQFSQGNIDKETYDAFKEEVGGFQGEILKHFMYVYSRSTKEARIKRTINSIKAQQTKALKKRDMSVEDEIHIVNTTNKRIEELLDELFE